MLKKIKILIILILCLVTFVIFTACSSVTELDSENSEFILYEADFISNFESLYSQGISSIEMIYPPDSMEDLGYVMNDGILYEVFGVFELSLSDGQTAEYLYCEETHPLSVPAPYYLFPIENVVRYSEATKDSLICPVFLKDGAVDTEGNVLVDLGSWSINLIKDGVYYLETHGGANIKVYESEIEFPDIEIYGFCAVDEVE